MIQKKILIFGNGLDCTYNQYIRNFNQGFKEFISLENQNKMYDILDQYDKCKCKNSLTHLDSIVKELRKELENLNDDFSLEDILLKIGNKIVESWDNSNQKEKNKKVAEIFHVIQNLIGAFICWLTIGSAIKFEVHMSGYHYRSNELFGNSYRPNLILTTNYTKSVEVIANYFNTISSIYAPIETKYLHGKIVTPLDDNSFRSIEINLRKKDESRLQEIFRSSNLKDNFQVKIFGLSIKNDDLLFHYLILYLSGMKKSNKVQKQSHQNELIYYYFKNDDRENFISLLKKNRAFVELKSSTEENEFKIINEINNTILKIKVIEANQFEWNEGFKKIAKEINYQ